MFPVRGCAPCQLPDVTVYVERIDDFARGQVLEGVERRGKRLGRLLADCALSSLLRKDWPRSLEEMEKQLARHRDMLDGGGPSP